MNETAKPQRNVPGGTRAAGQSRPDMPRRKPGAPSQAANYAGKKPMPPPAQSPNKRDESRPPLRDDEDTLENAMGDDE
jgi:hypothetical protein